MLTSQTLSIIFECRWVVVLVLNEAQLLSEEILETILEFCMLVDTEELGSTRTSAAFSKSCPSRMQSDDRSSRIVEALAPCFSDSMVFTSS